ncbi:hypothetical protein GCM10007907_12300 [Chitinimonas prasina]|uniref:DUF3592 domain-containing protein n=1 Tax=Chitinimonas prasina TaxID=1434937 RepID=A0ABQ5YBW3_9NEIS|nr:DUF3592 domain-containing protein [Chitinimonas prasina]GLR12440.1 hypothetical protein GCM10007907_12300 [Chitinimonas prasina]
MIDKIKSFLLVPVLILVGIGLLYSGVQEYRHSKALNDHGKLAEAVIEQVNWSTKRGRDRNFKADIRFTTEAGQEIAGSVELPDTQGKQLRDSDAPGTLKVKYLPEDTTVIELADHQDNSAGMFGGGAVALLAAVGVVLYRRYKKKSAGEMETAAA